MIIIDSHIHIGQWSDIFFKYNSTVDEAIAIMKKAGVSAAVCMPADNEPNEKLLNEVINNTHFKFYFNAWINPEDKTLDSFLDKHLKQISLFKIHPSIQRKRITDESYDKYLQLAAENKIPVIVHCGRWQEIASYKFCLEVSLKYPELIIILAHLGGDTPSLYLECASEVKKPEYKNVYLGTESVREYKFVEQAIKKAGAEKVIFGSDYNLCLPQTFIPVIENIDIPTEDKELIFSGNILRLLKNVQH